MCQGLGPKKHDEISEIDCSKTASEAGSLYLLAAFLAFDPVNLSSELCLSPWLISNISEGGMIRLETLIELTFLNSSFSSLSSCWN